MTAPTVSVKARFDKTSATWTEIGTYCDRIAWKQGRAKFLDRHQAGTLVVELDNSDRRFDPKNLSGPYVSGGVTQIEPMVQILVTLTHDATDYLQILGWADRWQTAWRHPDDARCVVSATDGFKILSRQTMTADFVGTPALPARKVSAAINHVLPLTSWMTGIGVVSTPPQAIVQSITATGQNVLAMMQSLADTDRGDLFMSPIEVGGDVLDAVTWRPYWYRQTDLSAATFSDDPGVGDLAYEKLVTLDTDDDEYATEVTGQRTGGTAVTVASAAALAAYADVDRPRSNTALLHADDDQVASWTAGVLYRFARFPIGVSGMVLDPLTVDDDDLWAAVCGYGIGKRITIEANPPGGGSAISSDYFIEGREFDITPHRAGGRWSVKWALSDASWAKSDTWWRIGDATYGKIGTASLAA